MPTILTSHFPLNVFFKQVVHMIIILIKKSETVKWIW